MNLFYSTADRLIIDSSSIVSINCFYEHYTLAQSWNPIKKELTKGNIFLKFLVKAEFINELGICYIEDLEINSNELKNNIVDNLIKIVNAQQMIKIAIINLQNNLRNKYIKLSKIFYNEEIKHECEQ